MAKRLLLRGSAGKPAASLLLFLLLSLGVMARSAFAADEPANTAIPATGSAAPDSGVKSGDDAKKPGVTEAPAGAAAGNAQPAARPVNSSDDGTARKKEGKAEAASAEKPAEPRAPEQAAVPKEASADAKTSEAKGVESTPALRTPAEPKEAKADAKPSETKPAEIKPALRKPAEPKEAIANAKPKDLAPKEGAEALQIQPSTINASYRIHFLGAHIGDFKIRSAITNRRYTLQANADVSVFFGTISWQGATSSYGLMTANGPVPQNYNFRYATNDRRETVELRFQQRMVQDIIINPPVRPGSHSVPITAAHLQNVLDPLSAIVLLTQMRLSRDGGEPCDKRLPIFDGRVRYDVVLSPKGTRPTGASGRMRGTAYVCKVNYVPIAGHKAGKQTADYATGNTGIEVWLVPVPEAGLLVPYYVHVPTPAGTASMVTSKFDLETSRGHHALAD
jgi:hypothetical protein